jgi:hypothetical protein
MLDTIIQQFILTKINEQFAAKLGSRIELHIKERTLMGLDKDNQPFKAYSTKPFALPAAAMTKTLRKKLLKQELLKYFKRNGKLFVVVSGGYAKYKALMYSKTSYGGQVNLSATGSMLRSFQILSASTKEIHLGFTRKQSAMVYYYNTLKGRDMLGITANDLVEMFNDEMGLSK